MGKSILPTEGGLNIRLVAVFAAVWFAVFALPVLLRVPEVPPSGAADTDRPSARAVRATSASRCASGVASRTRVARAGRCQYSRRRTRPSVLTTHRG